MSEQDQDDPFGLNDGLSPENKEAGGEPQPDLERFQRQLCDRLQAFFGPPPKREKSIVEVGIEHDVRGLAMRLGGPVLDYSASYTWKGGCLLGIDVEFEWIGPGDIGRKVIETHVGVVADEHNGPEEA